MLKRSIAAIQQWLSPEQTTREPRSARNDDVSAERRGFFRKAAIGTLSITGTAGLARTVVDSAPQPVPHDLYRKDALAGERELKEREYVLMSDKEKADMVQTFVDNYTDPA